MGRGLAQLIPMLVLGANDDHFFGELFLSRQILFEEIHDILAKNSVGIKTNIPTLLLNKQGRTEGQVNSTAIDFSNIHLNGRLCLARALLTIL